MTTIPPITDPMGRHWKQPPSSNILLDDKTATMNKATFDMLADYSASIPSGTYDGKMWKGRVQMENGEPFWMLRWYHDKDDATKMISWTSRRIVLSDVPRPEDDPQYRLGERATLGKLFGLVEAKGERAALREMAVLLQQSGPHTKAAWYLDKHT